MMNTPIQILLTVRAIGDLSIAASDKLRVRLPVDCDSALEHEIREQKAALLRLLGAKFLVVWSRLLDEIVFFVIDEETKQLLVASGAERASIYSRAELAVLVQHNATPSKLMRLHELKQVFNGTITDEP